MKRKWMNFETMFRSLKDGLRKFLKENSIKYELSGCGAGWHFEVYVNNQEVELINNWLDENTIAESKRA